MVGVVCLLDRIWLSRHDPVLPYGLERGPSSRSAWSLIAIVQEIELIYFRSVSIFARVPTYNPVRRSFCKILILLDDPGSKELAVVTTNG
ncbi:hypothetical protein D3C84_1118790 [compost metagenome]